MTDPAIAGIDHGAAADHRARTAGGPVLGDSIAAADLWQQGRPCQRHGLGGVAPIGPRQSQLGIVGDRLPADIKQILGMGRQGKPRQPHYPSQLLQAHAPPRLVVQVKMQGLCQPVSRAGHRQGSVDQQ